MNYMTLIELIGQCAAMLRSCGETPSEKSDSNDENSKFEIRSAQKDGYDEYKSNPKWMKICNEGFKFDNGESFLKVICSSGHAWTLGDGSPIPR